MNIVVVNDFGNVNGGAAKVAVDTAVGLSKANVNVSYFCASGEIDNELLNVNVKSFTHLNQEHVVHSKQVFKAMLQGLWNKKAVTEMAKVLQGFDKENTVIHIHGWTKSLSISCIYTALKNDFPVVITLHDFFSYCPNGGFYNFRHKYICKKKPLSIACILSNCDSRNYLFKIYRLVRATIERKVFANFKKKINFIALSKLSYDVLEPYISGFRTTRFIENPIDISKYTKVNVSANESFVFIGRLSYEKGVEHFCNAIVISDIQSAIVVGEGSNMESLSIAYPSIKFVGWKSKDQIREILVKARALIFPSVWYETYGLVVQEAASYGIPSIISNCTAACEFIEDGFNGLIFESENVCDLSKKIKMINDNDNFTAKLGDGAYNEFWKNDHTLNRYVKSLIDYYKSILNNEI